MQRHRISRLPEVEGDASAKRKIKSYPVGFFHIDLAEGRPAEGRLYMLVAIVWTSKLHRKAKRRTAGDFLRHLADAVPYRIHTVLTENVLHFPTPGACGSAAPFIAEAIARGEQVERHLNDFVAA